MDHVSGMIGGLTNSLVQCVQDVVVPQYRLRINLALLWLDPAHTSVPSASTVSSTGR